MNTYLLPLWWQIQGMVAVSHFPPLQIQQPRNPLSWEQKRCIIAIHHYIGLSLSWKSASMALKRTITRSPSAEKGHHTTPQSVMKSQ